MTVTLRDLVDWFIWMKYLLKYLLTHDSAESLVMVLWMKYLLTHDSDAERFVIGSLDEVSTHT